MNILRLTLKKHWFDLIKSGVKMEEYREIKDYWIRRLIINRDRISSAEWAEFCTDLKNPTQSYRSVEELMKFFGCKFSKYDQIQFFNGAYFSESLPNFMIECLGIKISEGKEEWGAEKGVNYFVLKLGKRL